MAGAPMVPIANYFETTYEPYREYIGGKLKERKHGTWPHARTQALLAGWFGTRERLWNIVGGISPRIRISPTRVRIPDLVVLRPGPQPDVLVNPPLLVIEILSPDDTYCDAEERAQDYLRMGVPCLWIIDPKTRTGRMCSGADWIAATRLTVPATDLYVDLDTIFAGIGDRA